MSNDNNELKIYTVEVGCVHEGGDTWLATADKIRAFNLVREFVLAEVNWSIEWAKYTPKELKQEKHLVGDFSYEDRYITKVELFENQEFRRKGIVWRIGSRFVKLSVWPTGEQEKEGSLWDGQVEVV
jgi:hypothetical protein